MAHRHFTECGTCVLTVYGMSVWTTYLTSISLHSWVTLQSIPLLCYLSGLHCAALTSGQSATRGHENIKSRSNVCIICTWICFFHERLATTINWMQQKAIKFQANCVWLHCFTYISQNTNPQERNHFADGSSIEMRRHSVDTVHRRTMRLCLPDAVCTMWASAIV